MIAISCNFPAKSNEIIVVNTLDGELVYTSPQLDSSKNVLIISAGTLSPGTYAYSLVVGGKLKLSKRMIIEE